LQVLTILITNAPFVVNEDLKHETLGASMAAVYIWFVYEREQAQ